jgi:hypothetical protein
MITISANVMAQDMIADVIINGDISYLDNIIKMEAISNLNKHELCILKKTILAKYGYKFSSADLERHFSKFMWYNGTIKNAQNKLTKTDWMNIQLIQSLEKAIEADSQNITVIAKNITSRDDYDYIVEKDIAEINSIESNNYVEEDYRPEIVEERKLFIGILDENVRYNNYEIYRIRHTTETISYIIYIMNHPDPMYDFIKIIRKYKMTTKD